MLLVRASDLIQEFDNRSFPPTYFGQSNVDNNVLVVEAKVMRCDEM